MNGVAAVRTALQSTQHLFGWFLSDLSDGDLTVRPTEAANHTAWQLGHLILAERQLLTKDLPGVAYPPLPEGFAEQHGKETSSSNTGFPGKQVYLDLFNANRGATLAALAPLGDADLDRPTTGPRASFAPTLGALLLLTSNHVLMHLGQVTVVRRKLGKPILI